MSELKEYIVTLKDNNDLDNFYEDMETPGGNLTIPNRMVDCCNRREISRNTHYMLTADEAELVKNDPRVLDCVLTPKDLPIKISRCWEQFDAFEKSSTIDSYDKNWGLYRVRNGHFSNWGTDSIFTQIVGDVITTSSGKNVDVVVVDSHINPNHPEFAVNVDGTGGSRVNQFNWFSYSPALGFTTQNTYGYGVKTSEHGTHVAGTVAGNTQGWARDANIYNIEFLSSGVTGTPTNWELYLFDYLRYFHKNKPINPNTGRRNPTITNHSWGWFHLGDTLNQNAQSLSRIQSVTYRGTKTSLSGLTDAQKRIELESKGFAVPYSTYFYQVPYFYSSLNADVEDAISDGLIVVTAAMNSSWNLPSFLSQDINNSYEYTYTNGITYSYYPNYGGSPAAAAGNIRVGAIGSKNGEYKAGFSNYGERITVWAPGTNIVSSMYSNAAATEYGITLANDPRNSSYKLGSISGTSMATPQVCGVLACIAEQEPNMRQTDAEQYLSETSTSTVGSQGSPSQFPYEGLGDSPNLYLNYKLKRQLEGSLQQTLFKNRYPGSRGIKYPRVNTKITKPV